MMDSLHFYLFHLMTSGLRMSIKQDLNEDTDDGDDDLPPYFDRSFSRISNFIINSKDATNRFTRLHGNKFNISAVNDVNDDVTDIINDENYTFLDLMYKHLLLLNKHNNPLIIKLIEIIETEEYDTYSVDIDLDLFIECGFSNLSLLLLNDADDDDKHLIIINQMIQQFNKSKSYVYIYLFTLNSNTLKYKAHTLFVIRLVLFVVLFLLLFSR